MYELSFLEEDEIHMVVNFLREKKSSGVFNIERKANSESKQTQSESIEKEKEKEEIGDITFDDSFLFLVGRWAEKFTAFLKRK